MGASLSHSLSVQNLNSTALYCTVQMLNSIPNGWQAELYLGFRF